jgi:hypothetical protein
MDRRLQVLDPISSPGLERKKERYINVILCFFFSAESSQTDCKTSPPAEPVVVGGLWSGWRRFHTDGLSVIDWIAIVHELNRARRKVTYQLTD